jgi:hypothetical protein
LLVFKRPETAKHPAKKEAFPRPIANYMGLLPEGNCDLKWSSLRNDRHAELVQTEVENSVGRYHFGWFGRRFVTSRDSRNNRNQAACLAFV